MPSARAQTIAARLRERLAPVELEVRDDGAAHAGHAGAAGGGGHFTVRLVADAFAGRARLARHRLVYDALGDLLRGEIHALSIEARTPDEATAARDG